MLSYTLERWGAAQTLIYLDGLEETAKELAQNPKHGKPCNDLSFGLRSLPYENHVMYYIEEKKGIVVARVLHERMSAPLHIDIDPEGRA